MATREEQLTDIRRDLFRQIRTIYDPLNKFDGLVTRDFNRTAGSCFADMLQLLTDVDDPEVIFDAVLFDTIIHPLLWLSKLTAQKATRSDTIVQGVLEILLFLLNNTLWPCTFTPVLMKQYLIFFINCSDQTRQNNTKLSNLDISGRHNMQTSPSSITSGATEVIKTLAIRCLSATLPISPSRINQSSSSSHNNNNRNKNGSYQHHHNMHLLPALLSDSFIYVISQCITELLNTIEHDHDLTLRLTALDTLHQLLFDNIQQSDHLISFMPGVVSKLSKVVWQKQEKENNQVISYALDLIGDMVQTVMYNQLNKAFISHLDSLDDLKHIWLTISTRDTPLASGNGNNSNKEQDESSNKTTTNSQQSNIKVERTEQWYKTSKSTLYTLLKNLTKINHHPNWNVRLAFVNLSYKLLNGCWATLDNCLPLFIDTMVQLTDDDYPQVSNTCKERITQLKSTQLFETTLIPELKEGLYHAILGLPQQLIAGDEQSKIYAMRRITGYTYFLQHHAETVFNTSLNRISDGWVAALEIDNHGLNVLEEKQSARYIELEHDSIGATNDDGDQQQQQSRMVGFPKLRFKHLATTATADQAAHMLNVIGKHAPIQRWLTHFMAYIQVGNRNSQSSLDQLCPQAAFIVHSLLAGAATVGIDNGCSQDDFAMNSMVAYDGDGKDGEDERLAVVQKMAQRILTDMIETLTVATTTLGSKNKAMVAEDARRMDLEGNRVVTLCLGLQIVSLAAGMLGNDGTTEHLITLLYPILAHLGSTNVAIHSYARITLDNIALICGEKNGRLLAMNNMDYIINSVSQRISMLYDNPQAPLVLKALVYVCGPPSLDYLQDSVEEIFDALDRYHLYAGLCQQLCGVLVEIVQTAATSISTTTTAAPATAIPEATTTASTSTVDSSNDQSSANTNKNKKVVGIISSPIKEFIKQRMEAKEEEEATAFDIPRTMDDIGKYFMAQRTDGKEDKDLLELMAQTENVGKSNDDTHEEHQTTASTAVPLNNIQDLTLKIMVQSTHFLTSPSAQLRAQMLQLFADGVRILAAQTTKLDPVIYQVWPLIMNRLDDKTHYVAFYAAQVIQVLAETRGEFISSRFMENVWPRYKRLLYQGNIDMDNSGASMMYSTYSYPHRLQRCLLETLILAAGHIPLVQQVVLAMVESTTWLLSETRVHPELQTLTIRLYMTLFEHHPDTVWLHVFSLLETPRLQPPSLPDDLGSIELDTLVVPDWMAMRNKDYYSNAKKIMASMEQGSRE